MSMIDITDKERRIAERVDMNVAGNLTVSGASGGVMFSDASQIMEFAKMMAISQIGIRKHLRGNPGACLAVCVQAVEWSMSPFAVANKSYLVNDQIAFESQLIQAVILKRAPIKGRFKVEYSGSGDKRICRVWAELKDEAGEIVEYESPEFGKITPKNSPLWKTDPDQQQFYYSGRALCRRHFPDILLGVYADDELLPAVGPERARDVTPSLPQSLSSKLEALADPKPEAEVAFPEEGSVRTDDADEIKTAVDALDITDSGDAPIAEDASEDESLTLLDRARVAATKGRQDFDAFFTSLAPEERISLNDEMKSLMDTAKKADAHTKAANR